MNLKFFHNKPLQFRTTKNVLFDIMYVNFINFFLVLAHTAYNFAFLYKLVFILLLSEI